MLRITGAGDKGPRIMVWQSRPIFISSTFADMQAERDHLRTHVFPALEERLKARRRHLEWVDLRLGVATAGEKDAEARELQVLKVCLAEVEALPAVPDRAARRPLWLGAADRAHRGGRRRGGLRRRCGRAQRDRPRNPLRRARRSRRAAARFFYFREPLPYQRHAARASRPSMPMPMMTPPAPPTAPGGSPS